MKCPKCRKWMPLEAMQHACGWRAAGGEVRVDAAGMVHEKRLSKEQAEVHLAKLRALVGKPGKLKTLKPVSSSMTFGHEPGCVCELCWEARQRLRYLRAKYGS